MPIINVTMASPLPDEKTCEKIIADLTEYFVSEHGKARERVVVNIAEAPAHQIGFGGKSVKAIKEGR